MPSHLHLQSTFEPFSAPTTLQSSPTLLPAPKKQKMSLTRTYAVASTARSKLGKEASRSDHNLRLLVGHANLLDTLMLELADAEREQEAWFNQSVHKASGSSSSTEQNVHVQWLDALAADEDFHDDDGESDSESESSDDSDYDEDAELFNLPLRKFRYPPVIIESSALEIDSEDYDDEDDDDDEAHALERVVSQHSPPELLLDDSSSDSEDDGLPASPELPISRELSAKEQEAFAVAAAAGFFAPSEKQSGIEGYVSAQPAQPLIAAAVY